MIFGQKQTLIANSWLLMPFLASLFAILLPNVISRYENAKTRKTQFQLTQAKQNIEKFKNEFGHYPNQDEVKKYKLISIDGWGNPLEYIDRGPERPPEIFSYGADCRPGGEGKNADLSIQDE